MALQLSNDLSYTSIFAADIVPMGHYA